MTLTEWIQKFEEAKQPSPKELYTPVMADFDRYIAAKQALALEEIAFQLRYIQETLRDA